MFYFGCMKIHFASLFFTALFFPLSGAIQTISFSGAGNRIEYDMNAGTYNVYFNDLKVIGDAFATANSNAIYNSKIGYTSRIYSSTVISDSFGVGVRHVITLTGANQLQMQEVFYTYASVPWFYAEAVLSGAGANCYAMSPLTTSNVDIKETGDTRALFVPFDNDAWVRYDAKPLATANFTGSEVSALYDDVTRKGLVTGSVEHQDWKSGVAVIGSSNHSASKLSVYGGFTDSSITRDRRGHGWVSVGATTCKSPKVFVGYFDDWRSGLEEFGTANGIAEPRFVSSWQGGTPFCWNSWGAIQTGINLTKAKAVVDFFANSCTGFRNDNTVYIDLDSYWDNLTDAELKTFCDYCKSKGMRPGIYWAPFVDWATWDRQIEGSTYQYSAIWTKINGAVFTLDGGRAIDPTHPGTKDRIKYFVNRFKTAGFQMVKLDFLGHAALEADGFYASGVHTGMQAYRNGMEYLCGQLGSQLLLYASISPTLATARYAHMRRIACDAYRTISETQYTLNSTNYGWWLANAYDYLDADNVVFASESLGVNRARLTSSVITGTLMVGDDFSTAGPWTKRAQSLLQNQDVLSVAKIGKAFRPVQGNTGNNPGEMFVLTSGKYLYCAIINCGSAAKGYTLIPSALGSGPSKTYVSVKELFSGNSLSINDKLIVTVNGNDAIICRFEPAITRIAVNNRIARSGLLPIRCHYDQQRRLLNVSLDTDILSIKVYSAQGSCVGSVLGASGNQLAVSVRTVCDGVYTIVITTRSGIATKRFVMNR
jgi:alpha-galactosidase